MGKLGDAIAVTGYLSTADNGTVGVVELYDRATGRLRYRWTDAGPKASYVLRAINLDDDSILAVLAESNGDKFKYDSIKVVLFAANADPKDNLHTESIDGGRAMESAALADENGILILSYTDRFSRTDFRAPADPFEYVYCAEPVTWIEAIDVRAGKKVRETRLDNTVVNDFQLVGKSLYAAGSTRNEQDCEQRAVLMSVDKEDLAVQASQQGWRSRRI